MRITVDIDKEDLASVLKKTGIRKHSQAVRKALTDYLRDMETRQFLKSVMEGKTDYTTTNKELEACSSMRSALCLQGRAISLRCWRCAVLISWVRTGGV